MTIEHAVLVDGVSTDFLPVDDRGLAYGDGVFRTLRVVAARPLWWQTHLAKLAEDCARIGLQAPRSDSWDADFELIQTLITSADKSGVLKLMVTRGSGPRGYAPPALPHSRRVMRFDASFKTPSAHSAAGVNLRICALRLGWQPRLAGVKHLNRLENVLARAEWNDPAIDEGLLMDHTERVISGVMSNLFIWRQNQLLTPRLDQCGVAGVARARLMQLAAEQGLDVKEVDLNLASVFDADEVMLTNSVWGLRRVARLDARIWDKPVISSCLAGLLDA
jgi:4-amino-4-deoxychorismate lyase